MEEKTIHPVDARQLIEDGYKYVLTGIIRVNAQAARSYFDNLVRLGVSIEEIGQTIEKVTNKGKIKIINNGK